MDNNTNNNPFSVSYEKIADTESLDGTISTTDPTVEDLNNNPTVVGSIDPPTEVVSPTVSEVEAEKVSGTEGVTPDVTTSDLEDVISEPEITVNPYYAAQRHLLDEGLIAEEDLNVKATWDDISNVFETRVEDRIKAKVAQELEAKGHNEQTLMYAQMIARGVDPQSLQPVNQMYQVASLKGREDITPEQKEAVIESMYRFKKYSGEEAKVLISNAKSEEDPNVFENLYNSSINYHESGYNEIKKADAAERLRIDTENARASAASAEKVKGILNSRKVDDIEFTKSQQEKLRSAIYDRDTVYTYQGKEQNGTKMDAFLAEFYGSDEMKIKAFLLMTDPEGIKNVAKNKAKLTIEQEIVRASGRKVIKKEAEKEKNAPEESYFAKAAREY